MTYGKTLTISRNTAYQRNRNTVSFIQERTGLGPVANMVVIILILCLLGLVYLTQVTKTNSLGYQLSAVKEQSQKLSDEHESLQLEAVRLQNLDRIKNSNVAQGLQEVQPSSYVTN
jgi:cell division protein FtsL